MVSALWNASSEGRLGEVQELLKTQSVDVNVKDQIGVTPLIEAVKNGHVEVVQALLAHGADPMSASSQGPPQTYTQDPTILELLNSAQAKIISAAPLNENGFYPEANGDGYALPGSYAYYPPFNTSPPDGAIFYPPPQSHADGQSVMAVGPGNLPPPEIARLIPCRYYPACRYGTSCLFAHPQGPYISGPLPPPAQYPGPYDPMNTNYTPNYYPMPAPSFQSPPSNGMNPILSPPNGVPSEMVPPQPFSPNGAPSVPYVAVSPVGSPTPFPPPPMSAPPLPQVYHQPPPPQQQAPMPPNMYNTPSPSAPPFVVQPNGIHQYPPPPPPVSASIGYLDGGIKSPPLNPQQDAYGVSSPSAPPPVTPREPTSHTRRGSVRRGSFNSRKPPCLFYPAGKCKNGDDCRFPHVMPEYPAPHSFAGGRGGAPRTPRAHVNGHSGSNVNGLETKIASLNVRDRDSRLHQNGHAQENHVKPDNRPRFPQQGFKNGPNSLNNKRPPPLKQQRVPNADDFPVLGNLASPSAKSSSTSTYLPNGNGQGGPTAAQIVSAPARRKDSVPATRASSDSGSVKVGY
ncbi:hypothetical protein BDP27DRAFT_880661 [Rhodocollybia butyracea]|uniref:C3H1-type domain-containing protein n=1 Tax=Rhodocollybia butyracea TaxID=206335 RepID=A0A9P5Q0V8_9AGAR|nr:hypothetical protein BDP27DRAFT_880661 [Rhodocollybia butyracea]